jgi:hypothetical protein
MVSLKEFGINRDYIFQFFSYKYGSLMGHRFESAIIWIFLLIINDLINQFSLSLTCNILEIYFKTWFFF